MARTKKAETTKKAKKISIAIVALLLFTGCSQYKSSWSCKNPDGIGCSSIGYADRIARKNIILNGNEGAGELVEAEKSKQQITKKEHKKLLINERYSDFKKRNIKEVHLD